MKLNSRVMGDRGAGGGRERDREVERVLSGCLFSLSCRWKVEAKWVLERTLLNERLRSTN